MPDETPPNPNGTEVVTPNATAPDWFIDDGIPGGGPRPSWLSEKFKSVKDMANSYSELEKKFGVPPDEYDMSKSKFIDPDYVPFQEFAQFAKEKRVSQEVVDKMLDSIDKYMDEFSTDYSAEAQKLGDNPKERLKVLDNWAEANLSKESYEELTSSIKTAAGVRALEELRSKMMSGTTMVPGGNEGAGSNIATLDEMKAELTDPSNLKKYKEDPKYRKDYQSRLEIAAKGMGVDKHGA